MSQVGALVGKSNGESFDSGLLAKSSSVTSKKVDDDDDLSFHVATPIQVAPLTKENPYRCFDISTPSLLVLGIQQLEKIG